MAVLTSQEPLYKFSPMALSWRKPLGVKFIRNQSEYPGVEGYLFSQRLLSENVGNSGCGENYCGHFCPQAEDYWILLQRTPEQYTTVTDILMK